MLCKDKKENYNDEIDELVKRINALNTAISDQSFLSEAYHIGPAYFKKYELNNGKDVNVNSLKDIYDNSIKPILEEYVRGRKGDFKDFFKSCENALGINNSKKNSEKNGKKTGEVDSAAASELKTNGLTDKVDSNEKK